jgi:hypothetical protein
MIVIRRGFESPLRRSKVRHAASLINCFNLSNLDQTTFISEA